MVFVQGCPWRCAYCHNPHLQPTAGRLSWPGVARLGWPSAADRFWMPWCSPGGEPLLAGALLQWLTQVRAMGFQAGLHTAGIYPERLRGALSQLDWVGLDIKTLPDRYERLTGVAGSASQAWASLDILLASQVAMGAAPPGIRDGWRRRRCWSWPRRWPGGGQAIRRATGPGPADPGARPRPAIRHPAGPGPPVRAFRGPLLRPLN